MSCNFEKNYLQHQNFGANASMIKGPDPTVISLLITPTVLMYRKILCNFKIVISPFESQFCNRYPTRCVKQSKQFYLINRNKNIPCSQSIKE